MTFDNIGLMVMAEPYNVFSQPNMLCQEQGSALCQCVGNYVAGDATKGK